MNNYSEKLFKYKGLNNEEKQIISEYENSLKLRIANLENKKIEVKLLDENLSETFTTTRKMRK